MIPEIRAHPDYVPGAHVYRQTIARERIWIADAKNALTVRCRMAGMITVIRINAATEIEPAPAVKRFIGFSRAAAQVAHLQ